MINSNFNSKPVNFAGIYGTATKIKEDGSKEEIKIDLPKDDARLIIADNPYGYDNSQLLLVEEVTKPGLSNYMDNSKYTNIKIDRMDKDSNIVNDSFLPLHIDTMADKAEYYAKNSFSETWINKITGKDTQIALIKGAKLSINSDADFNLKTSNFGPMPARVVSKSFMDIIG